MSLIPSMSLYNDGNDHVEQNDYCDSKHFNEKQWFLVYLILSFYNWAKIQIVRVSKFSEI